MGIEMWTNKETFVCGYSFRSKSELESSIKECKNTIRDCRERLKTLVFMTEPKKFYGDDEDVMVRINEDFDDIMVALEEAQITLTRLWVFQDAWDETHKDGKAILPVDPLTLKNQKTYMGGDYCDCILENGDDVPDDYWDVYHGWVNPDECSFRHIYEK